ncbi:NAD(P)-dependent oxidoreductase [Rhizobacter sp. AJA081-3]|uniref:NAD-dependent epimerase/dehydratase family protein n=1 Tax=Rhizobacter sp. AJA081-3 TaxID=2753607 RepID=UPI001AE0E576|nr:NAD(P)-dependent oxidoreductase [Rhizobacter sp. AJA081-3]QTN24259.1 NAD(P)-dependent oxidoreductase [Rhizobacter sp. AJA081-3]
MNSTSMQRSVLVTGGAGFLGRAAARTFKARGWRVVGVGHGRLTPEEASAQGFDAWLTAEVSLAGLAALDEPFDVVAHCAGNGLVGHSLSQPLDAFRSTVQSTAELLEHLRLTASKAVLVYPSSAGVYGAADDRPLRESDRPNPVSPYGYHKKLAEDLLECQSRYFGLRVAVIRFFSIYGPGLAKQLLWDAAGKLCAGGARVDFWGTGDETRDWIHVNDAAAFMADLSAVSEPFTIVNGASGERVTVRTVLELLREALGADVQIGFNGTVRTGDPRFYHADMAQAGSLGLRARIPLAEGLQDYAHWFKSTWSR